MFGMTGWYRESTRQQKKTFWACFSGWALDSYDIQVFSFLIPTLLAVMQLSKTEAGMLGTAALLSSALGGWVAGILSDRYGRVRILVWTIIWFTGFGVLAGFTQSFEQLVVVRSLQGLGFGGEWAVGAALIAEVIKPEHRGKAMGLVQSGYSIGWGLAAVVSTIIIAITPPDLAWRVVFWTGVLPAVLVLLILRGVKEPEVFKRAHDVTPAREVASFRSAFRPDLLRWTILASLLVTGIQSSGYALISWLPTLLVQERNLAPQSVIAVTLVLAAGAFAGFVTCSYLSDRLGRRLSLLIFCVLALGFSLLYTLAPLGPLTLMLLGFPVGFTVNGIFAGVGPLLSELFPTNVRATCMGFSYNFGKSVGALVVTFVGVLAAYLPLTSAIAIFCLAGYVIAIAALLIIPETRGKQFEEAAA